MCIIAYKPAGVAYPSRETLEMCFHNNPDGAGFAIADGKSICHIEKGFFEFGDFYNALQVYRNIYGDDAPAILHFRISTQAGVRGDCCHPFPISSEMGDLRKLSTDARMVCAHNGIIRLTADYYGKTDRSDTMDFITDYLSLIVTRPKDLTDARKITLIDRLGGSSRFALLDGKGRAAIIGTGWIDEGGVMYSNTSYKARKPAPVRPYAWEWGDYDAYDPETGLYFFDPETCPVAERGNASYCSDCACYEDCFPSARSAKGGKKCPYT